MMSGSAFGEAHEPFDFAHSVLGLRRFSEFKGA
jgi:hypothetical protein